MSKAIKLIIGTAAGGCLLGAQAAVVTFDHYDLPVGGHSATIVNGTAATPVATSTATGLALPLAGDSRTLSLDIDAVRPGQGSFPNTGTTERISANLIPDNLAVETGVHADVNAWVSYNNNGAGLGLDLDTPGYMSFRLEDAANDIPAIWSLKLTDGSANTHTVTWNSGAGWFGPIDFSLNTFALNGVLLNDIDEVMICVDPQGYGGDASFHAALLAIPEPHEYALFAGLGLMAFGAFRRFRSSVA